MFKPAIMILALLFSAAPVFAENEPSIQQVYDAAEAGKFSEAQAMMDKVLREHPNSAKAHFVEAEILAKQGQLGKASDELNTAERLKPGLPFIKPEVVQELKNRIGSTPAPSRSVQPVTSVPQAAPAAAINEWMPWILLLLGIGLVVFLIVYLLNRRNNNVIPAGGYRGNMPAPNMPPVATGPNGGYGAGPVVGQPAAGGIGSGLMGSLATGAALGAGVAAGEALVHHFLDGDKNEAAEGFHHQAAPEAHHETSPWTTADNDSFSDNYDMGGNDFGIADASSWGDDDSGIADSDDDEWA
ncbi:MAG: tetratricopeptide repeat protein [Methylobacter sp.]